MKNLKRIFLIALLASISVYNANANGNNVLNEVIRLSKQGLNFVTASKRLTQRFSPQGSVQPTTFTISGIPVGAKIEYAYVWISTSGNGAPITLTIQNQNPSNATASYPMNLIGSGADKCWGYPASLSYRANVTASITVTGNGNYIISGLPTETSTRTGNDVDGATLMVIYSDPKVNYIGNLIINDGSVVRAPGTATQSISLTNVTSNSIAATAFIGVGDFQLGSNSVSLPGNSTFLTTDWDFWNFYQRPTIITKGQTSASFTVAGSGDCWNWSLMGVYYQTSELELIGLEVNQTIQDWDNSIPLVEKKPTIVRAFVESNDATIKNLQPKLKVKRGSTDSIYLTADNVAVFKAPAQVTAIQDTIDRRKDFSKSLNYTLPPDWRTGTIVLSFEAGIACKEAASTPNDCKATITFNPSKIVELKFYNRKWTDENGNEQSITNADFLTHVHQLEQRILAMYPISKLTVKYASSPVSGVYNFGGAVPANKPYQGLIIKSNGQLNTLHVMNSTESTNLYLGIIGGNMPYRPFGAANGIPSGEATFLLNASETTVPHEMGHMLGREHVQFCGAPTNNPQGFPADNVFNTNKPSLGPMNKGVQKRIYGYNNEKKIIVDPEANFELMAYCQPRWISDFTYKALTPAINSKFSTSARIAQPVNFTSLNSQSGSENLALPVSEYRLVRGLINVDNNTTSFDPIVLMPGNIVPPTPNAGSYQLECIDIGNNVIKTISFEPTPLIIEDSLDINLATFIIPVLWDSSIKKIVIKRNNVVIGDKTGSVNIPTVHVLFPNGGERLSGPIATFTWEANDIDNDSLTYGVQFSEDGGNTWEMLDIDITDKSYVANLSFLGATTRGLVRILVSDGFNVAMDESDGPFQTPNSAPEAYITAPANGDVFVGEQPVSFSAVARDLEDGDLPDSALSWYSNIDGFLGHGANIYKSAANELSEGEHIIYFKAIDSFGDVVTDSIKIIVQSILAPGTIYYSKASGDLHDVLTWGENPDGSGANPPNFSSGKTFQLANRPGIYTMTGDWVVQGIISIQAGNQLQINGNTLSITNRIGTGTLSGSPASNLVVLASDDPFTLNLTIGSNSLNNLTVSLGTNATLGSVIDVYGILTVDGVLNTGATSPALLTFKSTASSTARLAPVTGTVLQGSVKTEQYIPARRAWRMMNSPLDGSVSIFNSWQESRTNTASDPNPFPGYGTHITGGPVYGFVANGFDQNPGAATSIKRYDNATDSWVPLEQTTSRSPHIATMIFIRGDRGIPLGDNSVTPTPTTLRHSGQLEVGNVNSFVFARGFTAVRNPYQSPINFATLTRDNVQNNFYVWDPKMGGANGTGAYVLISYNGSSYDVIPASVSPESQIIQTGQSFMVRTVNTGLPGSIIFKESDKSFTPTMNVFRTSGSNHNISSSNAPVFSDPSSGQGLRINLQVLNKDGSGDIIDGVFSSYKPAYSDKIDDLDGIKMANTEENLGIAREGQILMVERKSLPRKNDTIPLKLWNTSPKSYVLALNPVNLSGTGLVALLEDKYLKTSVPISLIDISKVQFTVTNDVASARSDRFQVVLTGKSSDVFANLSPTTLSEKSTITAYPNPFNGKIINVSFVNKEKGRYQITLVNSIGQAVFKKNITYIGGTTTQTLQLDKKLAKGIYQLQISNSEKTTNINLVSN